MPVFNLDLVVPTPAQIESMFPAGTSIQITGSFVSNHVVIEIDDDSEGAQEGCAATMPNFGYILTVPTP
jgi:hypothetical protein